MPLSELPPSADFPLHLTDFLVWNSAQLEVALCALLNVRFVQIESSGTAALHIALAALRTLSPRKIVVLPAYTCPLVLLAVERAGLRPVLCEVAVTNDVLQFDLNHLERVCNERTLCVVATHIGGLPGDMDRISGIAKSTGSFLIEDSAQALGAYYKELPAGTVSDIGIFSLGTGKGLSIGEGGFIATQNLDLVAALNMTGKNIRKEARILYELERVAKVIVEGLGTAVGVDLSGIFNLNGVQEQHTAGAARTSHPVGSFRKSIAASALRRLKSFNDAKRTMALRRLERLRSIDSVSVLGENPDIRGSWPFIFLLLPTAEICERVLHHFSTKGHGISQLYPFALPEYRYLGYAVTAAAVPLSEDLARRSITITNSSRLTDEEFEEIARWIEQEVAKRLTS